MSSFDLLLTVPRDRPRTPAWEPHAHLGGVVLLAVGEGALGGWLRGGVAGVLVGGLIGLLVGPILAWWLWIVRRSRRSLRQTVLLGLGVQTAATLLIAAAVQWLVGVPMLEVIAGSLALLLGSFGVPLLMFATIMRERTWAIRGGLAGILVGAVLTLVAYSLDPAAAGWRADLLVLATVTPALSFVGMILGAFAAAASRMAVRIVRRLRIRIRCRRQREADNLLVSQGLHLGDVSGNMALEAVYQQTALLLLSALREGVEVLHFETLGAICRVRCEGPGTARQTIAVPIVVERFAALIGMFAEWDYSSGDGEQVGRLPVTLGEPTLALPVRLCIAGEEVRGSLRLPIDRAVAERAGRLWRDYAEYRGDAWGHQCLSVPLQRQASEGRGAAYEMTSALIRLFYEGEGPKTMLFFQVHIELDGRLLRVLNNFAEAFDEHLILAPGPHLLQLIPSTMLSSWRTRTFVLDIVEPGVYEVQLNWDKIWGGFKRRLEVRDWTARVASAPCPQTEAVE